MAFSGFKKQLNKASQLVNEKVGSGEVTKLDDHYLELEKRTDITNELVDELQKKTVEYLQPNGTARAKMAAAKEISKLRGHAKDSSYPQPEGILGDCMITHGRKLAPDDIYGSALVATGGTLKKMSDFKDSLDDNVKHNFIDPLHDLQTKELKEIRENRKKVSGYRLEFDATKRSQASRGTTTTNVAQLELQLAEEKFKESLQKAEISMQNLLEKDLVEQLTQLSTLSHNLQDYHNQCAATLKELSETLEEKKREAATRSRR